MRVFHLKTARSIAIGAAILGFAAPGVLGWGPEGHEIVATIAQIYTHPAALQELCRILNRHDDGDTSHNLPEGAGADTQSWPCHLSFIATWADKFKDKMRWSVPLHFANAIGDNPPDTCVYPGSGPRKWAGEPNINILGGIHNTSSILISYADGEHAEVGLAEEALKFIVHFFGDLHMPLHLTGKDRGGNQVDVCWEGKETKLHLAWDDFIVEKAIRTTGQNYTKPLPAGFERVEQNLRGAVYDPLIRRIIWEGVEGKWAEEQEDWVSCSGEKQQHTELDGEGADNIWSALRDFFFPGWFARGGVVDDHNTEINPDTEFICPYHWSKPTHPLLCELIWPKGLGSVRSSRIMASSSPPEKKCKVEADAEGEFLYELNNPSYMGPIEERMLLEQFLGQGGLRLAATLNYIFGVKAPVAYD